MERVANVGTVVSIGDPVVTVSDLSSLWLIAAINEAELSTYAWVSRFESRYERIPTDLPG